MRELFAEPAYGSPRRGGSALEDQRPNRGRRVYTLVRREAKKEIPLSLSPPLTSPRSVFCLQLMTSAEKQGDRS
jgi:hypothetical protein